MQFAVEIVPFGDFSDPNLFSRLAEAAEAAGWDGIFVWDHLAYVFGWAGMDPWVALSAAAVRTEKIRLGIDVIPLPRYRPHVLAQTIASLEHLSRGRVVLGFGLGGTTEEFRTFGEDPDLQRRAALLDEGLEVLDGLLRGWNVDHHGHSYTVQGVTLIPQPVQQPRPPIWIGGETLPALRRAAHWDGWVYPANDMEGNMVLSPDAIAEKLSRISAERGSLSGFDCALSGCSQPGDADLPASYARVGATWWLETLFGLRGSADEMLARVKAGPPK